MRRRATLAALALFTLSACNKPAENTVDDAALEQIGSAVEGVMNEPGAQIFQILKSANGPIALDALEIAVDQRPVPVDWWLWRRGFVQPLDAGAARPTFVLTDKAREQAASDPDWFETTVGDPTNIDCKSAAALEALGCEVEVEVTPTLTAAGKPLAAAATIAPIKVHALVAPSGEGWEVTQLGADGPSLHDVALNVMLGPDAARQEQRRMALGDLNIRQTLTAAAADPSLSGATIEGERASPPPSYDVAPVAPVIDTTPKRPGLR